MTDTASSDLSRRKGTRRRTEITPFQENLRRLATQAAREPTNARLAALTEAGQLLQAAHRAQFGAGEMPAPPGARPEPVERLPAEGSAVVEQGAVTQEAGGSTRRSRVA